MLKFLAKDSVTFDTEFVPDADIGRRMYCNPLEEIRDAYAMEAMWASHPDYDEQTNPRPFLKPILQKVVSLAYVRRTVEGAQTTIKLSVNEGPEANMIEGFLKGVGRFKPQLVGYNSEGCDLPLLVQRAMVHGLTVPQFCARPEKPWEGRDYHARYSDWHIDLMHELGGFGRSVPSLSEACAALDILGGAKDLTGADVVDLYLAGDFATIHRYCAKDAVRQFLILLRLALLAGHITREQHEAEAAEAVKQLDAYAAAEVAHG